MQNTRSDLNGAAQIIADLRMRLLDLRNGNKLLSYKHSERGKTQVRLVDEQPDFLHECLTSGKGLALRPLPEPQTEFPDERTDEFLMVLEELRRMDQVWLNLLNEEEDTSSDRVQKLDREIRDKVREVIGLPPARSGKMVSIADWARINGVEPSFELPKPLSGKALAKHTDGELQTLLLPDELQGRMAGVRDQARTALQDLGVNLLHLAVGFLEWFESPTSDKALIAPLLLYPAELDRKPIAGTGQYRYTLRGEQDPIINITLKQRLANDFNLIVPEFEENDAPESYMERMAQVIKVLPRWRIRRFATIGLFSFSRLAMYNDLDPARWGNNEGLASAGVLGSLFSRKEGQPSEAHSYDLDDRTVEAEVPVLIRDADSSQHQAIIEVMRGRNLVIQGPPGTGKSQTIANIIAASLSKGKSVLFVAEKGAALDVVKKRLDEAGIGEFCLELHSTKVKKTEVLGSLERRLNIPATKPIVEFERAKAQLYAMRDRLSSHSRTVNTPFGALDVCDRGVWRPATIYDILWREQRMRSIPFILHGLERIVLSDAILTTRADEARRRDRLMLIERMASGFHGKFGSLENHPWSFVRNLEIQFLDEASIVQMAVAAGDQLARLWELRGGEVQRLCGGLLPVSLFDLLDLSQDLLEIATPSPLVRESLVRAVLGGGVSSAAIIDVLDAFMEKRRLQTTRSELLVDPSGGSFLGADVLRVVVGEAESAGLEAITIAQMKVRADAINCDLDRLDRAVAISRELFEVLGLLQAPICVRTLMPVLDLIELLPALNRRALLARTPSVLDEGAADTLERAKGVLGELLNKKTQLQSQVVIDSELSVTEVRRLVSVLKSTSFFGRFFSEYRSAKKACLARLKSTSLKDEQQVIDVFQEVADYLEEQQRFENDRIFSAVCAHHFRGLETDVDLLVDTNKLGACVRSRFVGLGEIEKGIRKFLFDAEMESIDALRQLGGDERVSDLRLIVGQLSDSTQPFELKIQELTNEIVAIQRVSRALIELGFRSDISPKQAAEMLHVVSRSSVLDATIRSAASLEGIGLGILSGSYSDLDSILESMSESLRFVEAIRSDNLPNGVLTRLTSSDLTLSAVFSETREVGASLQNSVNSAINAVSALWKEVIPGSDSPNAIRLICEEESIPDLSRVVKAAITQPAELMPWIAFQRAIEEARADGLGDILDVYDQAGKPYTHLVSSYERLLYVSLAKAALKVYPQIAAQTGQSLDDVRSQFRNLDKRILEMQSQALVASLAATPIPEGVKSLRKGDCTEAALIRNEIGKKMRHIPIRELYLRASNAIRAMKPCLMMSPSSVSQYLNPNQAFDIVIIDEASQMRPEESIGTLARGKQAVIVGDTKQLPPSNFFARQDTSALQEDDGEYEKVVAESVLDVASVSFHPMRKLLWHYRSRHGALIAFSNRHFYGDELMVFPSPQEGSSSSRVRLVRVEGRYRASVNVPEAHAVAEAAIEFMTLHPDKSLGIVALNQPQRDLILGEMDRIFARDSASEDYRAHWQNTLEPFFVKNLENVQGDERDFIFISTVYGPDENGNLMQRFGPINGAAGDRRLNVLFSRAKIGVTVFSSMSPDKIRVDDNTPRGTRLLKEYLQYAATGRLDAGDVGHQECDSDFEHFVKEHLEAKGYEVFCQIGVAGFRIDLGVKHPKWPHGFLLGIECDGATYHSSLSARDRDRLRQQVLESLGWTIYRVWSTDWFLDQNREINKMVSFIERTLKVATGNLVGVHPERRLSEKDGSSLKGGSAGFNN